MYRLRTIDNLLGKHKELENQEIYFASSKELNDPMEGFLDIFWDGDEIVWENFLKHYLFCVQHIFFLTLVSKKRNIINADSIPVFSNRGDFLTQKYKLIYQEIETLFFEHDLIKNSPANLAKRISPIRRDELLSYFQVIHLYAIDSISTTFKKHRLLSPKFKSVSITGLNDNSNIIDLINQVETKNSDNNLGEKFFFGKNKIAIEYDLITSYSNQKGSIPANSAFLFSEFPEAYISRIELIVYPNWYTACFMSNCNNSSVWGHYGDKHRGVCLKFKTKTKEGNIQIDLEKEYGWNDQGAQIGMVPTTFHKVKYENNYVEIDFFKSLGRLQVCKLEAFWYSDKKGNLSRCADPISDKKNEAWMDGYWDNFFKGATIKSMDWSYETEYRLLVNDMLHDYQSQESRKLKYNFNDLEGIIFGIKTSKVDKLKILKVIEEKCKKHNRTEFDFYQAFYSKEKGKIEYTKLNLIKFK